MNVFLSYGYNDRDRWVKEMVTPILQAFAHDVVTGEDMAGSTIVDQVSRRIDGCQAILGFATRREPAGGDRWTTHRWVTDELAYALARGMLLIEVRETGIDPQGGIVGPRQHLVYDEAARDRCLVEIVKGVGAWPRGRYRLQLVGENIDRLIPVIRRQGFRCVYRLNENGAEGQDVVASIRPITGGLFLDVDDLPPGALIQVEVSYGASNWTSSYESLDSHSIRLIQGA